MQTISPLNIEDKQELSAMLYHALNELRNCPIAATSRQIAHQVDVSESDLSIMKRLWLTPKFNGRAQVPTIRKILMDILTKYPRLRICRQSSGKISARYLVSRMDKITNNPTNHNRFEATDTPP